MFSVFPTPRTSFAPIPPTPMHAMFSLSLGARRVRPRAPRTCGGTIVNANPVATSPTNSRREMGWECRGAACCAPTLGLCGTVCSWQHSNLDVPEGDQIAVILQADVTLFVFSKVLVRCKLARRNLCIPVAAAERVLDHFHAVEPLLHVIPVHHKAHGIPLVGGLHNAGR